MTAHSAAVAGWGGEDEAQNARGLMSLAVTRVVYCK